MNRLDHYIPKGGLTLLDQGKPVKNVPYAVEAYLSRFTKSTRNTVQYVLSRIALDFGIETESIHNVPWDRIKESHVIKLFEFWRNESALEASTQATNSYILRGLLRTLAKYELYPLNELNHILELRVKTPPRGSSKGRSLSATDIEHLIQSCLTDQRTVIGLRDSALLALLLGSGIRRAEVARLTIKSIDLASGTLNVMVKGGHRATRYITGKAIPHLERWINYRLQQGKSQQLPLFSRISKSGQVLDTALTGRGVFYILEQRSIKANLPFHVRPHDCRRTLATELLSEHGELVAQKVLGHARLETTKIYDMRSDQHVRHIMSKM